MVLRSVQIVKDICVIRRALWGKLRPEDPEPGAGHKTVKTRAAILN